MCVYIERDLFHYNKPGTRWQLWQNRRQSWVWFIVLKTPSLSVENIRCAQISSRKRNKVPKMILIHYPWKQTACVQTCILGSKVKKYLIFFSLSLPLHLRWHNFYTLSTCMIPMMMMMMRRTELILKCIQTSSSLMVVIWSSTIWVFIFCVSFINCSNTNSYFSFLFIYLVFQTQDDCTLCNWT